MKYQIPDSLEQVFEILEQSAQPTIVAGGTDVMVWIKNKKIKPQCMVDISQIKELKEFTYNTNNLVLGSVLSPAEIIDLSCTYNLPQCLIEACSQMGAPAVRNLATIGGNLGTASPAGDISTALLGLRAELEIRNINGSKLVPLTDFFLGPGRNALAFNDIISRIYIPNCLTSRYLKLGLRKALSISIASAAGSIFEKPNGDLGLCLALGAVAPTPIRARKTENSFTSDGKVNLQELGQIAASETSPISDLRASAEYRREMVTVLVSRLLSLLLDDLKNLYRRAEVV